MNDNDKLLSILDDPDISIAEKLKALKKMRPDLVAELKREISAGLGGIQKPEEAVRRMTRRLAGLKGD